VAKKKHWSENQLPTVALALDYAVGRVRWNSEFSTLSPALPIQAIFQIMGVVLLYRLYVDTANCLDNRGFTIHHGQNNCITQYSV